MFIKKSFFILACFMASNVMANQYYVMPPTSSTYANVPVISDAQMEQCVEIYNQAKWLEESLQNAYIDPYSNASVNTYNQQVARHSQMLNWFNQNCAGKQSYSACESARELNRKNGIPTQDCH